MVLLGLWDMWLYVCHISHSAESVIRSSLVCNHSREHIFNHKSWTISCTCQSTLQAYSVSVLTSLHLNIWILPYTIYSPHISTAGSQARESAHTYSPGYPVELLREAWYHPLITQKTAEERLKHAVNGCFLVRESETKPGCFSLSLKHPGGIVHFSIDRKDSGLYGIPGTHKGFTTLPDLFDYFTRHSISEDPCHLLSSPCLKAPPSGE